MAAAGKLSVQYYDDDNKSFHQFYSIIKNIISVVKSAQPKKKTKDFI